MNGWDKLKKFVAGHLFLSSVVVTLVMGILGAFAIWIRSLPWEWEYYAYQPFPWADLLEVPLVGVFLAAFLIYPVVLTAMELWMLVRVLRGKGLPRKGCLFDIFAGVLGVIYSLLYLNILWEVHFDADWTKQLYNAAMHTPVYTESLPAVIAAAFLGVAGYCVLQWVPLRKMPPLWPVLAMSGMYLGAVESVIWLIQLIKGFTAANMFTDWLLALLPVNCIIITARLVAHKFQEWQQLPAELRRYGKSPVLQSINKMLDRSEFWPVAAFLLMWPLLGLLIGILILFGQSPDAMIKAWTETTGWSLSQRVGPQNLYYDEHYLCTVAAGGHDRVVKPRRMGVRHGHRVVVNRQLCIANAFEQVLEERTPRLHRAVRGFYDTCGFPVAKLIRSKYAADAVYVLMKPLEWMFLLVLYLTDVNPESRIAIQYTGKSLKDFM